jgi:hypothetical protein
VKPKGVRLRIINYPLSGNGKRLTRQKWGLVGNPRKKQASEQFGPENACGFLLLNQDCFGKIEKMRRDKKFAGVSLAAMRKAPNPAETFWRLWGNAAKTDKR